MLNSFDNKNRGITGIETAIILIAFVVVATVLAFTVLSTGVFSAERSKDTIYSGLQETRSTLEPRGAMIAYTGGAVAAVQTVYKVSFNLSVAVGGQAIDLTPPYSEVGFFEDPDLISNAEYRTIVSYLDQNQYYPDVPWTVDFVGEDSGDNLLEVGEKAEMTVWLLQRDWSAPDVTEEDAVFGWDPDPNGAHGILETGGTLLTPNDKFTLEIKPSNGAVVTLDRTLPPKLDLVIDLR